MSRPFPAVAVAVASVAAPARVEAQALSMPVAERTLDNGLRVLVLEDRTIPNVALYVGWRVGSRNEAPGTTGLAHFFEHMMFTGGARFGGRFDPVMEAGGGANNAYTTNDVTVYQDWLPASLLPVVLDMEADRMAGMVFRPETVESERGVVASERRLSMDDPTEVLREQLWATAYVAHPYQWPVLGWMSDIERWEQADLEAFFRAHYAPRNAVVVIVGAVDPAETLALVAAKLGHLPPGPEPAPVRTREPEQRGERRVVVEAPGAGLPQVMCAWHIPETAHPDFPAWEVIERLLLQGESSRLHRRLVEEERVCLAVDGGFAGYQVDPSLFTIELTLREGVAAARAEALLEDELTRLAAEGPTPRELERVKNQLETSLLQELKTIGGKAGLLLDAELFFGGWRRLPARLEAVAAVDADAVRRVAGQALVRRNRTVALLETDGAPSPAGADAAGEAAPDDAAARDGDGDGGDGEPDDAGAGADEATRALLAGLPRVEGAVSLPAPVERRLANGLTLLLVRDPEVPLLTLVARAQGGALEDAPGKEGTAALLAALLGKGAGARDAQAFAEAIDFVGGGFAALAGSRWLETHVEVRARDAALGVELLADALRRPRLDADELEKARGLLIDAITAARDDPSQVLGRYWQRWALPGHPLGRPAGGHEPGLAAVTREDVVALAARALVPSRVTLAVAGDFDPAALEALLAQALGDWATPADAPAPPAPAEPAPTAGRRLLLVDKPDALQTHFSFGGLAFDWRDPDFEARHLANTVLGGRFTSRLNQALRVEAGLTYGARSGFDDVRRGVFALSTFTATATSEDAIELALAVYRRFRAEGITQAELDSARNYVKGQYAPDALETAEQRAGLLLALRQDGLDRARVDGFFARLDALDLAEVNRVILRLPPPERLDGVVIGQASALRPVLAGLGEVTEVSIKAPGFGPGE